VQPSAGDFSSSAGLDNAVGVFEYVNALVIAAADV